jgi:hypothetical protein
VFFDENNSEENENPIEGLGREMLPDRGMPFDDIDEKAEPRSSYLKGDLTQPRDLTPEKLAELLGGTFEPVEDVIAEMSPGDEESEGGMSAVEPILTDADITEIDLPVDEIKIPAPIDGPSMPDGEDVIVETPSLDEEEEMLAHFVTEDRLSLLWARIDAAQQDIKMKVPNMTIARELIAGLEKARNELLAGKENYEEAERTVSEVELRIVVVERAKADNWAAIALFLYEVIWAVLFTTFFLVTNQVTEVTNIILVMSSAIWGGIGGVTGAFYALWKHVARDVDFSKQYYLWYITNPIMGLILGAFIYLVMKGSLLSMTAETSIQDVTSPFIIYLLAFIVGYQQNVAWALVRRIVQVFQLSSGNGSSSGSSS